MDTTNPQRPVRERGFYAGRVGYPKHLFVRGAYLLVDLVLIVPALLLAIIARFAPRPVDIGIGPLPTINSRYHKKGMERFGYRCETFVYYTWYFTKDFDVNIGRFCPRALGPYVAYAFCLFRYKCIYCYFTGGPLGFTTLLARCEPYLLRIAGIRTVVLPFGADVQVLTRSNNLLMVHGFTKDYPGFRLQYGRTAALLDTWTRGADHIVSGCDWVDYMYHWDTLMLSHFAIDTEAIAAAPAAGGAGPLRLLHAPNHRHLKGTNHLFRAVDALRAEGVAVELTVAEGVPNERMPAMIRSADVIVDQLVVGWYAMFALEAMASARPVVCFIRPDLRDLYTAVGLIEPGELPLIDASVHDIKAVLKRLAETPRSELAAIGQASRIFAEKHHSIAAIGRTFDAISRSLGVVPSREPRP